MPNLQCVCKTGENRGYKPRTVRWSWDCECETYVKDKVGRRFKVPLLIVKEEE